MITLCYICDDTNQSQAAEEDHEDDESLKVLVLHQLEHVAAEHPELRPEVSAIYDFTAPRSLQATLRAAFVWILYEFDHYFINLWPFCLVYAFLEASSLVLGVRILTVPW